MLDSFRYPLDEIRERCELVEIISAYVALRKRGKSLVGLCPFHNEKTPSFHVSPDRQIWKCYGCGEGGDVFSFVRKIDNLTFPEAVEHLARKAGVVIERSEKTEREFSEKDNILRANNIACSFFRSMLEKSPEACDYLAKRGIVASTIEKYRIGYAPDGWDALTNHLITQRVNQADAVKAGLIAARENSHGFYDRFRDRIIFPIIDTSERVIAFGGRVFREGEPKYLNSPETPVFSKTKTLYGLNTARRAVSQLDRVLVVEGYMDVISVQEAGFENAVATLGTALTEEHVNIIARFTKNVVLAFDADSAGMAAAQKSAPIFERSGFNIRILSMPKGEDPDSLLRNGDTSQFAALLEKTLPLSDFRIKIILSKHDMKSDEGKSAALKEIIGILAEIESIVERERLIRLLARFHPNFNSGTTLAEEHLRAEANRLRSQMVRHAVHQGSVTRSDNQPIAAQKKKISLVERTERTLLGIILIRNLDPNKVFDLLSAKEFVGEYTRLLAEAMSRHCHQTGKIEQESLRSELEGTPAGEILTDLLIGADDSELTYSVEELVNVIINHKKNDRRQRMRALHEKIQEGTIKHGDEEYEEYYTLIRETSSPWRR